MWPRRASTNRQPGYIVLERIRRWERGEINVLVEEAELSRQTLQARSARHKGPPEAAESTGVWFSDTARRAIRRAIQDGALSKAAKVTLSDKLVPARDIVESLRRLHPAGDPVICPMDNAFDVVFENEEIAAALKSFPPGSSGGPSNLRASHLVCPDSIRCRLHEVLTSFMRYGPPSAPMPDAV